MPDEQPQVPKTISAISAALAAGQPIPGYSSRPPYTPARIPSTYVPAFDSTPGRIADSTKRAADQAEITAQQLLELTDAMRESVRLSAETRADAAASAESARQATRHAFITGYGSLGLGLASTVLAVVAILTSIK